MRKKELFDFDYLFAFGLSFFLTLLCFGALLTFGNENGSAFCLGTGCSANSISNNAMLNYLAIALIVYTIEFFFILRFVKQFGKEIR